MWAASVIFKNLPKEKQPTKGENSPNLIALIVGVSLPESEALHKTLWIYMYVGLLIIPEPIWTHGFFHVVAYLHVSKLLSTGLPTRCQIGYFPSCSGWSDALLIKWPKMWPNPFFVKIYIHSTLLPWNKDYPPPKKNKTILRKTYNRPIGENSANLASLIVFRIRKCRDRSNAAKSRP
jgi:hypothetical protein